MGAGPAALPVAEIIAVVPRLAPKAAGHWGLRRPQAARSEPWNPTSLQVSPRADQGAPAFLSHHGRCPRFRTGCGVWPTGETESLCDSRGF